MLSFSIFVASSAILLGAAQADDNGALVALSEHHFRFTREFVPDDMFEGTRCALSSEPMRQYDPRSPGQLFQSCWGGTLDVSARSGSAQLSLDGISLVAIAPLGNEAALTKQYNMSHVSQFTPFASLRIDPATEMDLQIAAADADGTVTFQTMLDAQLQPLLNVSRDHGINVSALAALPLVDGPNFFLARFFAGPAATPNLNLTGAALRKELLGNSIAIIKFYVVISASVSPVLHWEVLGATRTMIDYTEQSMRDHRGFGGGLIEVDTSVAAAGLGVAVVALLLSLALCCVVWRMRRANTYSTIK